MDLNKLANELHEAAVEKGFWSVEDAEIRHVAKMLSELGEAVQADRVGIMYSPEDSISGKPEGVAVELGDFVMMALDFAARLEIDLDRSLAHARDIYRSDAFGNIRAFSLPEMVMMLAHAIDMLTNADKPVEIDMAYCSMICGPELWLEQRGYNLWEIIREKMKVNENRPKLHGRLY